MPVYVGFNIDLHMLMVRFELPQIPVPIIQHFLTDVERHQARIAADKELTSDAALPSSVPVPVAPEPSALPSPTTPSPSPGSSTTSLYQGFCALGIQCQAMENPHLRAFKQMQAGQVRSPGWQSRVWTSVRSACVPVLQNRIWTSVQSACVPVLQVYSFPKSMQIIFLVLTFFGLFGACWRERERERERERVSE
jgi:hypothetical protein